MSDALNGKVVAVTGAAGFIGGRLVSRLAGESCTILRVARSSAPPLTGAAATIVDIEGDVVARAVWNRVAAADVIIHLAAQTSVAVADEDPGRDFCANVLPLRHLIDACRARGRAPIVLFAGTVTEAGAPSRLPVNEDAPDDPLTTYDRHKLMAERELETAAARGDVRGATLRLANVYGPDAHGRREDRHVLNRMIRHAVDGQPLTVHGSGDNLRDYVFIDDVVDAFLMAAAHSDRINARHFVIGSGRGITIRDAFGLVAQRAARATGRAVPVTSDETARPPSPIERRHFVADHSRFSAATGWQPKVNLRDGIDRTIEALACA